MRTRDGFVQAYNAQASVDAGDQIIVAHQLTNAASDQGQLMPLVEASVATAGTPLKEASADAGRA